MGPIKLARGLINQSKGGMNRPNPCENEEELAGQRGVATLGLAKEGSPSRPRVGWPRITPARFGWEGSRGEPGRRPGVVCISHPARDFLPIYSALIGPLDQHYQSYIIMIGLPLPIEDDWAPSPHRG